jgi:hypothetical protein
MAHRTFPAVLLVSAAVLPFLSCTSPLSDVAIEDPSVIEVDMRVTRDCSQSACPVHTDVETYITDRNAAYVEIQDGGVSVNGVELDVLHMAVGGGPYYKLTTNEIIVQPDSEYVFTVLLSDGSECVSSVRSQAELSVDAPSSHSRSDTLVVTWGNVDYSSALSLSIRENVVTDSSSEWHTSSRALVEADSGVVTFLPSELDSNVASMSLTLRSVKSGTVYTGFRSGSEITSTFSLSTPTITLTP